LHGAGRVPVFMLENGDAVLVEPRAAAGPDARVATATLEPPQRRTALASLLQRAGESRSRAKLALGPNESLLRRVSFPAATEENLRQVLAFEMDRLTPFRVDDVYFDYRIAGRDAAAGTVAVILGVARRDIVDARIAQLRDLGVNLQGVTLRDDLAAGPSALELMPSEQRGMRESANQRNLRLGLSVAVALLLIAVLALPIWRKREAAIAMLPLLAKAEAEARATEAIAREVDRQVADYNYLHGRKYGTQPALAYVEELSRLLPDNTWLQQLEIKPVGKTREVQVTGETPSSSRLIELLQQSQLLQNARTSGTTTRGSQPGVERFMIAADATPRPAPEPRSVLEGVPAPGSTPTPVAPATPAATPPPAAAQPAPAVPAKVQPVPDGKAPAKPAAGK